MKLILPVIWKIASADHVSRYMHVVTNNSQLLQLAMTKKTTKMKHELPKMTENVNTQLLMEYCLLSILH